MSNRNRQAKPTGMTDKKLEKAKQRITQLEQQVASARMSILNMRQMYEAAVQEKQGIRAQLERSTQIIVALAIQGRGNKAVLKEKTFAKLSEFQGYDQTVDGGDLVITAISAGDYEDMKANLEEETEDDSDG